MSYQMPPSQNPPPMQQQQQQQGVNGAPYGAHPPPHSFAPRSTQPLPPTSFAPPPVTPGFAPLPPASHTPYHPQPFAPPTLQPPAQFVSPAMHAPLPQPQSNGVASVQPPTSFQPQPQQHTPFTPSSHAPIYPSPSAAHPHPHPPPPSMHAPSSVASAYQPPSPFAPPPLPAPGTYQQQQQPPHSDYQQPMPMQHGQPPIPGQYQSQPQPQSMGYGQPPAGYSQSGPPMMQQHAAYSQPVIPEYVQPVHSKFMALTCSVFPNSGQLRLRSQIPFGAVLRPLAPWPSSAVTPSIPVINPTAHGVIRCLECRAYINPFVAFSKNGAAWRCNLCGLENDVPPAYFAPLDHTGRRQDVMSRPELFSGTVEIVAPADYMLRPPMPPTYVFLIDVSLAAGNSGVLGQIAHTIRSALDALPGDERTQIGFLTFDSSLHFYSLRSQSSAQASGGGAAGVSMWVCTDIDDVFLPQPADLLVNLHECREQVEQFLSSLPTMFAHSRDVESCFGPALEGAIQVMARIGGKLSCFLSSLPSLGVGRLVNRENGKLLGTDKEQTLLQAAAGVDEYKKKALTMSRLQISCDLYILSEHYMDIAALSDLSRTTGGSLFYYPGFSASNGQHANKLEKELTRALTREQGWESVVRIRATKGVGVTEFHGNFHVRGSDLLALPHVDADKAITFELRNEAESAINDRAIVVQAALLYTTSSGERRIRVLTSCLPITTNLMELYDRFNCNAAINLMVKQASRTVLIESLEKARDAIRSRAVALIRTYRSCLQRGVQQQQNPELALLPLMTLGAVKNLAFKEGSDVRSDVRAFVLSLVYSMPLVELETFLRPRLLPVHDMKGNEGLPEAMNTAVTDGDAQAIPAVIALPPESALTAEVLKPDAAYLLDNGLEFLLRIGRQVNPTVLQSWFGVQSMYSADAKHLTLLPPEPHDSHSPRARLHSLVEYLRSLSSHYQCLFVVKEGEATEGRFFSLLIEDRQLSQMALMEFEQFIQRTGY